MTYGATPQVKSTYLNAYPQIDICVVSPQQYVDHCWEAQFSRQRDRRPAPLVGGVHVQVGPGIDQPLNYGCQLLFDSRVQSCAHG